MSPVGDALPYRWMPGTPSFEAMAGTAAAIRYIASLSGVIGAEGRAALSAAYRGIAAHEQALCRQLLLGLQRLPVKVFGPADPDRVAERAPTVAFTHATRSPAEVAAYLGERGVFVWHGNYYALELSTALGCEPDGMVRVGILHYNTDGEIDRLLSLLAELGSVESNAMGRPPPPPGAERRRTHRVELLAQVQLRRGDGEVFLLPVVNISAGGAFLRLEAGVGISSLVVGDQVDIFLDLGSSHMLDLAAQVLRIDVQGQGGGSPASACAGARRIRP